MQALLAGNLLRCQIHDECGSKVPGCNITCCVHKALIATEAIAYFSCLFLEGSESLSLMKHDDRITHERNNSIIQTRPLFDFCQAA